MVAQWGHCCRISSRPQPGSDSGDWEAASWGWWLGNFGISSLPAVAILSHGTRFLSWKAGCARTRRNSSGTSLSAFSSRPTRNGHHISPAESHSTPKLHFLRGRNSACNYLQIVVLSIPRGTRLSILTYPTFEPINLKCPKNCIKCCTPFSMPFLIYPPPPPQHQRKPCRSRLGVFLALSCETPYIFYLLFH